MALFCRRSVLLLASLALPGVVLAQSTNEQAAAKGIETKAAPAVVFFLLYLLVTAVQWFLWFRNGRQAYMLNLTIGMTCMTIGFLVRIKGNYAWQFLPCAFLANDYVVLKHVARSLGEEISSTSLFIPARGIVWIFVLSDIVTFCAQTVGTVFVILGGKWLNMGEKIAISGLLLQLLSFLLFTAVLYIFAKRLRSDYPTIYSPPRSSNTHLLRFWMKEPIDDTRALLLVLGLTCIGISIRSVFRLIEQADGFFGYIATHEAFFYLLDAAPLWLSMALFCPVWPPRYIAGCEAARDEALIGV
ncbi:Envelope glycoprotein gp160 [Rhodotorula kratochvilovae]